MTEVTVTTKLGLNRGAPRIWVEGKKLELGGFTPGSHFNVQIGEDRMVLSLSEEGKFKVSGRTRNGVTAPIIDLNSSSLYDVFEADSKLRLDIKPGQIEITVHISDERVASREKSIRSKIQSGQTLKVCSLFHGGGVLDRAIHEGFRQQGIAIALSAAVELEPAYLDASLRNNAELWGDGAKAFESPIEDVCPIREGLSADILVAGIPCTGASRAGRSKNKLEYAESHEAAGTMFFHFLKFVEAVNPAVVIVENVTEYANTASMEVISSVLKALRYNLELRTFDSFDFGAIEKRRRMCLVAVSQGLDMTDVLGSVAQAGPNTEPLSSIMDNLDPEDPAWKSFDYLAEKEQRDLAAGKGFKRQLLSGSETHCGTIGKDYAKCRSTEPFLKHPTDPTKSRILTPAEHARVKGAPLQLIQGLSNTIAHQVLGQSVVYTVFKNIGAALAASLTKLKVEHGLR